MAYTDAEDVERTPLLQHERDSSSDSQGQDAKAKVPWAALWALWVFNVIPGLAFEIILPFVNQMLLENGVVNDPEQVGYYSGVTESLFAVVQILTVVPFSYLTDIVGRKPIVVLGNFGVAVSTVCFGMSKTFSGMLLSRSLGGALGGSWAAMRVMMSEMVPKHYHATAFGGMGMTYRIGQIVGLPLGGFLAHPERHLGFTGDFWVKYPFALPCFVGAAFAILTGIYGMIALRETLKNPWRPCRVAQKGSSGYSTPSSDACSVDETPRPAVSLSAIFTKRTSNLLLSNFLTAFFAEVLFALYPLFGFTPRKSGGLGLTEAQIGMHMSARAICHMVLMVPFPALNSWLGMTKLYKLSTTLWPVTIALFPIAGYFAYAYDDPDHPVVWASVIVLFIVWSFTSFSWCCLGIMINDATPTPEALSRLNAISQLTIVIPQAIAPATGTALFATSLRTGILHGNLIWVLLFITSCLFAVHAWFFIHEEDRQDLETDEIGAIVSARDGTLEHVDI